jgi:hypothetical protein
LVWGAWESSQEKMGMSLAEIHRKKIGKVSDKWSSYLDFYDDKLWYLQDSKINLLEIGVQNGGSLETWSRYFWKAEKIVGIDVDPKCADLKFDDKRIQVVIGDAKTVELEDTFDIIIDDGSHQASDIIANWNHWWPKLNDGGVYVVEDFHTMWMPGYGSNAIQFFAGFIAAVNGKAKVDHSVKRMEFQNSLVLLEKGEPVLGDRLITGDVAYVNPEVMRIKYEEAGFVLQHQPA